MLGVCYYPEHWHESRWKSDAARMRAVGISHVRIGEFAWSRIEPARDSFDYGWLDRAIDVLHEAGLKVIFGTPTATPPKWLIDECPDILPVDEQGRTRGFGSRRHYTFSSSRWWKESARIVEALARRYGSHPGIVGWQTDNEFGCHGTTMSWGEEDLRAFRDWLRRRYQSADQLNTAWNNVFWSMEVADFDAVTLPNLTVADANPAARMDFWRFASEQVAAYNAMQAEIIRRHAPGRWVTHNFMGFFTDFDHYAAAESMDLASWDSYPLGFVEVFPFSETERTRWAETSHPDVAPFNHDLYRSVGRGRFSVMEQQAGPVNWAPWNAVPKPGMIRLWTLEAIAHGAEFVSYFRWRQATAAQEQMHSGLNLPGLDELSPGGEEVAAVAREIAALGDLSPVKPARVAIVMDYPSHWAAAIQPLAADFRPGELAFRWYEALRRLGLDVDFVRPGTALDVYDLVLIPTMSEIDGAMEASLAAFGGVLLVGPRSGSRDRHFAIPENLPPGPLAAITGNRIIQVSTLRPGLTDRVSGDVAGSAERWREHAQTSARVLGRFANGDPALTRNGNCFHLLCWPDEDLLKAVVGSVVSAAGLSTMELPEHVRIRRRGDLTFAFNYGPDVWEIPNRSEILLGGPLLAPQSVAVWRSTMRSEP